MFSRLHGGFGRDSLFLAIHGSRPRRPDVRGRERSPTRLQRCCYSIGVSKRTEEMSGASKR